MVDTLFSAAHLNIWSLLPKFNILKGFLLEKNYDIFALSETWLNASVLNESINITGYNLIRKDRPTRGGGVAIYLKDSYLFNIINTNDNIEQLWISTTVNKYNFVFGVCYNPPRTNSKYFTDNLEDSITLCMPYGENMFCFGDININLMDGQLNSTRYFLSMLESLGFHQVVNEPTHLTDHSASLLDVILCNNVNVVSSVKVGGLDISNHDLIACQILVNQSKILPVFITYRDFKYFNENEFYQDLQGVPLHEIFYMNNIDVKVNHFTQLLIDLFNKHVPLRTVRISKNKAPWLTDNIKLMMKQRDKARADCRRNPSPAKWLYYKRLRNATNHAQTAEKLAYFNYLATNKNSKYLWGELKSLNITSNKNKFQLPFNLSNPDDINDYFIDSIPHNQVDIQNILNHYNLNTISNSNFKFSLVSVDSVKNILQTLKNTSAGTDLLSIFFIKLCCPYILNFIVHIINSILLACQFPTSWKTALVSPIPKINDPKALSDLRPISILSGLSKLTEKVIEIQIRQFVDDLSILPSIQSGFRPGYSCSTAVMHVLDDIIQATDVGMCTVLILLDYSKAFDTLDYTILLAILKSSGFDNTSLKLLESYLTGRSQIVKIVDKFSQPRPVFKGVPQGSILGPLLFSIYTSQLIKFIQSSSLHMYADDTQLYYSFRPEDYQSAMQKINSDLRNLSEISVQHSLNLNPSKSAMLIFGKKSHTVNLKNLLNIELNGSRLRFSNSAKNLGLILDNTLRFRDQVSKMVQKAYAGLRLLYPHRKYLNSNTKKLLCDTLVLSQFTYCAPVYGPCLDCDSSARIQRVQNSCIRFIYGLRKFDHVSHKLIELRWLNMAQRRKLYSLCLFHKIIKTKTPPYLYNKITFRSDVHNINIRSKGLLSPPIHKTTFFERCFKYCIYRLYNGVSLCVKSYNAIKFRKYIKINLLGK